MVCIDSDILIDFLKKESSAMKMIERHEVYGELKTTVVNSFEVLSGISQAANPRKYAEAINFFTNLVVLDIDFEISQQAAKIFEELKSRGKMIDVGDILIAATVIANNESLLTRNTKHFERIPGLKLETVP